VRNGTVMKEYRNEGMVDCTVSMPGVYRVQVFQDRTMLPFFHTRHFPWILSNPIYIYLSPRVYAYTRGPQQDPAWLQSHLRKRSSSL
jgi:hypothetical protein